MKSPLVLLSAASVLTVGLAIAQDKAPDAEPMKADAIEERYGHLEKGKSGFKETWFNPETDCTKFDKIYFWEAEFQYRDVGPARRTRSTMMNTRQREFGILEKDQRAFEDAVSEAFTKEMEKGKRFSIVDEIAPGTLILRGGALDIVSNVPPEFNTGMNEIYMTTFGEVTLLLELIDAESGDVVAVVAERRAIGTPNRNLDSFTMPTNSVTVTSAVRRWATSAAGKLRKGLDDAIKG